MKTLLVRLVRDRGHGSEKGRERVVTRETAVPIVPAVQPLRSVPNV